MKINEWCLFIESSVKEIEFSILVKGIMLRRWTNMCNTSTQYLMEVGLQMVVCIQYCWWFESFVMTFHFVERWASKRTEIGCHQWQTNHARICCQISYHDHTEKSHFTPKFSVCVYMLENLGIWKKHSIFNVADRRKSNGRSEQEILRNI